MRRYIYKKIHYLTFDLDLRVKGTRNVTQYPLHHVIYASTKFQVARSNGLGEDTITRNVTDGWKDRQTDRLWYEINITCFSTGPRSAVGNVSGNRCESDCHSRGCEFDPGPVPYFRGD